ncbi:MocR-like pyridoxine biosynthesis transcription factor PdxR [Flavitalea flava]
MLPFPTLITIDRKADFSVYQQIANQLAKLIRDGIIQPGSRLPGSREMAAFLKVHRKTVVAAYEELDAQDWIEITPRKGIHVSPRLPGLKPRSFKSSARPAGFAGPAGFSVPHVGTIPEVLPSNQDHRFIINDGMPDSRLAPMDLLIRTYKKLITGKNPPKLFPQSNLAGALTLRDAISRFLTDSRGLTIGPSNTLITRGAQMAIYLAARLILKKGDQVIVSKPNYFLADSAFEEAGARLLRVPVDEQGIDVAAVEALCKKKKIRMLYIIPHHHHPTTVTLSMDRRMKLLDIIHRYKLIVIEDDYDYDFHYSSAPILPLASADHGGQVIYIGSLTKSLTPSIRMGYMIATPDLIEKATQLRRIIDIRGDYLMEEAMALFIRDGDLARHLKKTNKIYRERRDYFCDLLTQQIGNKISFSKPDGGLAIWARFHPNYPLPAISARASSLGLFMNDGRYYNGKENYNGLRLGFASLQPKEMDQIIEILRQSCP